MQKLLPVEVFRRWQGQWFVQVHHRRHKRTEESRNPVRHSTVANKTVSIKGLNIIYKQEVLLQSIIETGLTIAIPQNKTETIRTALYLIYKIALESTIEIKSIHAELLRECHIRNAYSIPVKEEDLLDLVPGASPNEITELDKMKCIEIINGYIYLRERVIMPLT